MIKIATYKNGNVLTTLYDDGTKTHFTKDDDFRYEFPECHDISTSQCCDNSCRFCYYGCTPSGKHGRLTGWKFFETMRPYTEVAINIQKPLPLDSDRFILEMYSRRIIVNITINQNHFMDDNFWKQIDGWINLGWIKGIGISLTDPTQDGFIEKVKRYPNAVIHVIAGVLNPEDLVPLMNKGLKLLILGYKTTGRGNDYFLDHTWDIVDNINWLKSSIDELIDGFEVISFDNLAVNQLGLKDKLTEQEWEMFYGGEDGTNTFFIDLVKGVFARNSLSQITYPIGDKSIDEMFEVIKNE